MLQNKAKLVKLAAYGTAFFTAVGMWLAGDKSSAVGIIAAALTGVNIPKE